MRRSAGDRVKSDIPSLFENEFTRRADTRLPLVMRSKKSVNRARFFKPTRVADSIKVNSVRWFDCQSGFAAALCFNFTHFGCVGLTLANSNCEPLVKKHAVHRGGLPQMTDPFQTSYSR